jgi:hypothetical protein
MKIIDVEAEGKETEAIHVLLEHINLALRQLQRLGHDKQFCANSVRSMIPILLASLLARSNEDEVAVEFTCLEAATKEYKDRNWFKEECNES